MKKLKKRIVVPKISAGYILFIIIIGSIFFRVINYLGVNDERGAYAYVQILNFSMPIVEEVAYADEVYAENNISIKKVITAALGIDNINPFTIVGGEILYFKNDNVKYNKNTNTLTDINPFNLSETSIAKVTEAERAELAAISKAYNPKLKKTLNQAKPEILIYHTHESEGYLEGGKNTDNEDFNVVGVGAVLKKELEENYGISVIHDKTVHSRPSYNECYNKSRETVQRYLDKYGDFKMIIDLHRDATDNKDAYTLNINDEEIAKIMFVNSLNSPRVEKNLQVRDFLKSKGDELFPGFVRNNFVYNRGMGMFNQHLSDNSVLIECGATINNAQEAKRSAKYIARLIAEYINSQE